MVMKLVDAEQLESDLTSVADKIRAKTGGEEKLAFPSGFESALDTIESADSALAEVEYLMSNGYTDYSFMFSELRYMTELPVGILQNTKNGTKFEKFCYYCSNLKRIPQVDVSNGEYFGNAFQNCLMLESIASLNTVNGYYFGSFVKGCPMLITIEGIDLTNATYISDMFNGCKRLENITFNGSIKVSSINLTSCNALTHDSLMSAINALHDYASEGSTKSYYLWLGSTNLAKLTDAEKAIATQRGWTLA